MEGKKEIKDFFEDITALDNKLENEKQEDFNNLELSLPKLANKIYELKVKREERLKATKGRFNLFTTLLKIGDETKLHSRFITHLLNPQGNHDCGSLFLDLFIDTLMENKIVINDEEEDTKELDLSNLKDIKSEKFIYGRTEQSTKEGRRIDIYLEFKNCKIAIENKIWAKEQDNQIADYAKEIEANDKNNFLFYLTLDGKKSETSNKETYFPISYEKHILKWLEKCLQATYKYININQAIQQYQNVIKELTNQTMEKEEMKEIEEMIKKNPAIIKYQNEINNSINQIRIDSIDNFWRMLRDKLNENTSLYDMSVNKSYEHKQYESYHIKNVKHENIIFEIERDNILNCLYIGLCKTDTLPKDKTTLYKNKSYELNTLYMEKLAKIYPGNTWKETWLAGYYYIFPDNFYSTDFLIEIMTNENKLKDIVDYANKEISGYIDDVGGKINNIINN